MIFFGIFLSHSTKKSLKGTLLCSRIFQVSKKLMDKRWVEYHDFLSEMFCLTVPKKIVPEPFSVSLILVSINFMH